MRNYWRFGAAARPTHRFAPLQFLSMTHTTYLNPDPGRKAPMLVTVTAFALLCALLLWWTPSAAAGWATFAVDDSMSQVQAGATPMRWRHALPSRNEANVLDATLDVRIVLNLSPWVGKPARIYMVMPPLPQSSLSVQWTTAGALLPGRLSGGQRQLVFQGIVPGPRLEDTMRVTASADARDAATPPRVNFTFEIEVPSK
jgi:hypothetical protein